ncbi:MAG: hypothetical protein IKC32_03335, partial [Clostridia bacterium]|nr:hypothetical protein [Clostridia bacterium]
MKKLTKILAATLLLSLVLSCFGMFSAFAEEVTEEVVTTSDRVVVYDMDALEAATLSNAEAGDSITKVTDELGNTYWQIKKDSAKSGT